MHECPECGEACDCDSEDMWFDESSEVCEHECEEEEEEEENE